VIAINYYKATEAMLYNYNAMHAEIRNIDLEIEELQNEYNGPAPISYEEKSTLTNKFNSNVENEVINKDFKPGQLEKRKHKLEIQIKKIDNALNILDPRSLEIIKLRYFYKINNRDIAEKLNLTEEWICKLKNNIINRISNLINI
jgi:RNA polymerase sigma factor (sigma-70 family)